MNSFLISVVDDDEAVRIALDGLLRSLGHRVQIFGSAEAFLETPALREFDCVISDINMPGMSGIALIDMIGAAGLTTPVILISAHADEKQVAAAAQAGARCFLKKPFSGAALIKCIDNALGG